MVSVVVPSHMSVFAALDCSSDNCPVLAFLFPNLTGFSAKDTAFVQMYGDSDSHHLLHLKSAVLGVDAVKGERNVVEIRTRDFEGKEQRHHLTSLTLGQLNLNLVIF